MKMICNKASECRYRKTCKVHTRQHEQCETCKMACSNGGRCIPVAPRRKPVVAWVMVASCEWKEAQEISPSRKRSREWVAAYRKAGWAVRGPVRVVLP
jgi:hypothetical protein